MIKLPSRSNLEISYWNRKIPVGATVSKIDLIARLPMYIGPNFRMKYRSFVKRHKSISLPSEPYFNAEFGLPEIEITIDCARKDLPLVASVIKCAVQNVKNPVNKISVVVPWTDMTLAAEHIQELSGFLPIQLVCEEDILSQELRNKIKKVFPERYGWVIHQFLTLQQVLNSRSQGLLSIDSDTLILRPMAFLNNDKIQVLMESLEYNLPYYEFLNKVNEEYPINTPTHVTHYSFFQKEILEYLFQKIRISSLVEFFDLVELFADRKNTSPFCIDREFYALGMRKYFPQRYTLVKFANISVLPEEISSEIKIAELSAKYNSVSCHSYLQNRG